MVLKIQSFFIFSTPDLSGSQFFIILCLVMFFFFAFSFSFVGRLWWVAATFHNVIFEAEVDSKCYLAFRATLLFPGDMVLVHWARYTCRHQNFIETSTTYMYK